MKDDCRFCTFHLGDLFLGVEVFKVQEVLRYQEMTRVPLASYVIRGLINLRGQIVTAIDLRRLLGLGDLCGGRLPMNVVLNTNDGTMSLLVDDIGDVTEVDRESFEAPPETLRGAARELICGTYQLADRLLLVLATEKIVGSSLVTGRSCKQGSLSPE